MTRGLSQNRSVAKRICDDKMAIKTTAVRAFAGMCMLKSTKEWKASASKPTEQPKTTEARLLGLELMSLVRRTYFHERTTPQPNKRRPAPTIPPPTVPYSVTVLR